MKKIMLVFAAFVAMSIASCSNGTQPAAETADSTNVDSLMNDSVSTDSVETPVVE